jgi:hypothetical protein
MCPRRSILLRRASATRTARNEKERGALHPATTSEVRWRSVAMLKQTLVLLSAIILLACRSSGSGSGPKQRPAGEDDCTYCQGVAQKAFDDCVKACGNPLPENCCLGDGCCTKCAGLTGAQGNAFNQCCTAPGRDCNGDPNGCVDLPPQNNPCDDTTAHTRSR